MVKQNTGIAYVVKRFTSTRAANQEIRMYRELHRANTHPHIVKYYGQAPGQNLSFRLEYLPGGCLTKAVLRSDAIPPRKLYQIIRQVASALHFMHTGLQLIHGDVKTDNVLLDAHGQAKLCDFGFARKIPSAVTGAFGTPMYYSPEFITSEWVPAYSNDVWALGVMLFWCLSKGHKYPYGYVGDYMVRTREILFDHILNNQRQPLPADVPPAIQEIVYFLLHPDPCARMALADLVPTSITGQKRKLN